MNQKENGKKSSQTNAISGEKKQKSLTKNAALNVIRTLMSLIFPLITFPYSSRILGPIYKGKVAFADSLVKYFAMFAALGISTYGTREVAKLRDDKEKLSAFVTEIFTINVISMLCAYVLFAFTVIFVTQLADYTTLLCISSTTILFNTLAMEYLYGGLEEYKYITIRAIFFQALSLVLLFVFVKKQEDYVKYAALHVVSSAGSCVFNFAHSRKFIKLGTRINFSLRRHLKPIFILFLSTVAINIYTVLDTTMLGFLKGDESVGIYTCATRIDRIVLGMVTAATGVLFPRFSYYAQEHMKSKFESLMVKSFQVVVLLSIPCCIGLFMLATPLVSVFGGPRFFAAVPVMRIMSPIIIIIALKEVPANAMNAMGKEKERMCMLFCAAAANFLANLFLIRFFGAAGAAAASVLAETISTAGPLIFMRKFLLKREIFITTAQSLISSFVMMASVFAISFFVNRNLFKVIFSAIAGAFVYALCLLLLKNKILKEVIAAAKTKIKAAKRK